MLKVEPANPQQFNRVLKRISSLKSLGAPNPILVLELWLAIRHYYGGHRKALWAIAKYQFRLWCLDRYWLIMMRITDRMCWTKVYEIPESETHYPIKHRHGCQCSGSPNCSDEYCIERGIPGWFKAVTFYKKFNGK